MPESPSSPGSCSRRRDTGPGTGTVAAYDLAVVDEAIVNAVAHRDYAIAGSKIRLFLFADRLGRCTAPGGSPTPSPSTTMP